VENLLRGILKSIGIYKLYEKWLLNQVKKLSMPEHIAVILDGNRRWALEHSLPLFDGHAHGAKVGKTFLEWCIDLNIKTVTLYVFSTENFQRPKEEVENIMKIIEKEALELSNDKRLHKNRVRVKAIGRVDLLPQSLREILKKVEESTKDYKDHYLNIAIAYGGRAEIIDATKKIAEDIKNDKLKPEDIDEELFMNYLYTAHLPNPYPDLIIRTSGEERLSGFLLWQSAYSELCFLDVYWPDFRKIDLLRAIRTYQRRKRRFGC
jgi:tritrans,polycis-undecaprenyl-diphosphate synthase [geranylgeranyl-diphosphate specific]